MPLDLTPEEAADLVKSLSPAELEKVGLSHGFAQGN
jgi:hypothetical protein